MLQRFLKNAYKMLYLQSAIVVLLMVVVFLYWGKVAALSAFLGGLVWILPTFYFIHKIFGKKIGKFDSSLVYSFFSAEIVKFLISVILIIVMVKLLPIEVIPFLSGFVGAVLGTLLFPLVI
jgi:ATP synthase protein I